MTTPDDPRPPGHAEDDEIDLSDLRWDDSIVFVVFWTLAFVVFLQFFTRYVLNNSLGWTEEIARFLLIGVTFIGGVMATRKHSHIAVEFIYRWVPRPVRRVAQTVIDLICTSFFSMLAWYSYQVSGRTQQMMVSVDIPKSLVYQAVALSFAAMALYAAVNAWRHLRTGTSRLIDPDKDTTLRPGLD